jgi:hypothetical protein
MAPIPIAMAGKITPHALAFSTLMLPEYEIVYRFESVSEFHSAIGPLMSGTPHNPSSRVGTNTDNATPKIPLAMFVGGGFSPEELKQMRDVPEARLLPWVHPSQEGRAEVREKGDLMAEGQRLQGPGKGVMEVVVARVKECFRVHGIAEGEEGWEGKGGELWYC